MPGARGGTRERGEGVGRHAGHGGGLHLSVYSDASVLGGAEASLHNLLGALRPGIDVTVLATDRSVAEYLVAARPGTGFRIVPATRAKRDVKAMLSLRRTIAELRPDVLHANLNSLHSCQYALALAQTVRGVAVIAVEHSLVGPETRLSWSLKRWTSRRLAAHVAVGEASARDIERRAGLTPNSVRVIHNGVPDLPAAPLPRVTESPCMGTVARLDPIKGLDVAVDALALLPDVHLVIVGDGTERAFLEERASRLGVLDRTHLVGPNDSARDMLAGFDVFVLPSRSEAFPLTVIEAMLARRPVVATRVGSVAEAVVDGVTGVLVAPGDPDALASAVGDLIADPARRSAMGRAGRERATEQFGVATMAQEYEAMYDSVATRVRR